MDTSSTTLIASPPTLLTLPSELLRRILDFLLTGRDIKVTRQFPPAVSPADCTKRVACYSFQPAILRVSKDLHSLARETFEANNFIMVSRLNAYALRHVQTWKVEEPEKFSNCVMRLTLVDGHVAGSFLVCIDALPELVAAMKQAALVQSMSGRGGYHCVFELKHSPGAESGPSLKLQKQLLEPFMTIKGFKQGCHMVGNWNTILARKLQKAMVPKVLWFRALDREILEVVLERKNSGDEALSRGYYIVATDNYLEALYIVQHAKEAGGQASRLDDETFWIRSRRVILSLQLNMLLTCLHLKFKRPHYKRADIEAAVEYLIKLKLDPKSPFNILHGGENLTMMFLAQVMATVLLERWTLTRELLAEAQHFDDFTTGRNRYDETLKLARHHSILRTPAPRSTLQKLFDTFPTVATTHTTTLAHTSAISATIDMERYILQQLQYDGDLLEDEVVQKEGWSVDSNGKEVDWEFDSNDARRYIRRCEESLERQYDIPQVIVGSPRAAR